jgi:hypothetical protein
MIWHWKNLWILMPAIFGIARLAQIVLILIFKKECGNSKENAGKGFPQKGLGKVKEGVFSSML